MMEQGSISELLQLTDDDLRHRLLSLDSELRRAVRETERLERAPQAISERLENLERYFADLRRGDTVRMVSPELYAEMEATKAEMGCREAPPRINPRGPSTQDCGGEDFLALDRNALHHADSTAERRQNYHPTVHGVHFAGHLERAPENVHAAFVCPGGRLEQRSVEVKVEEGFWLEQPWRATRTYLVDDPPLFGQGGTPNEPPRIATTDDSFAGTRSAPKGNQESVVVDWLGLKRRGLLQEGMGTAL